MPRKIFIPRQLPSEQPDRCELCPLVGIIPKAERRKGKRERYFCLGIFEAETDENGEPLYDEHGVQKMSFPRLSSKGIAVSFRQWRAKGHLWHRPCDYVWPSWMTLPGRVFGMPTDVYNAYRIPYEKEQMIKHLPKFKFRRKREK